MGRLIRVDAELVRRGMARSRAQAAEVITAGVVLLDGVVVSKPARQMDPAQALLVREAPDDWASRGAYKLLGALDALGERAPTVKGRRCLDAGASTGGFTDVLLRRGAAHVVAVDVGYGQLIWRLRSDSRVTTLDRTNVRTLTLDQVGEPAGLITGDLSFISLKLVLPALVDVAASDADFLLMVKPQFEVGKQRLGHGGVVREAELREESIVEVAQEAIAHGLSVRDIVASPLPGPAGNVEYFLSMTKVVDHVGLSGERLKEAACRAVAEGPQGAAEAQPNGQEDGHE